jgi:HTH-type transcriptional regulator, transcriptional repressor of NAD biosynthesis genes
MRKKTGLTLGKYAPLHKGHQYVFETALEEVDELIVLIYDTDVVDIPLQIRSNWIKRLYPQLEVIECWGGPQGYSSDRQFEIEQENHIIEKLNGKSISHFYSSEFYGGHVSKALNAIDRRVDKDRQHININATKIRSNPLKYKEFIPDIVYHDLITKIVFLGAMSTGKSTLTEVLAKKYNTTFAAEYGREYWTEHEIDRRIEFHEFDIITKIHIEKENDALLKANKYLFVDTNAITTYMYCMDYHNKPTKYLKQTALENYTRYDLFFLCSDDIPYDDTWDRSGPQKREIFQKQIISDLIERRIPFITLEGDLNKRIETVSNVLEDFKPYTNYFGNSMYKRLC